MIQVFFGGTGELREYEEEVMGLMGQVVEERRQDKRWRVPPSPKPNWTKGADSPFLLFFLSFLLPLLELGKGETYSY